MGLFFIKFIAEQKHQVGRNIHNIFISNQMIKSFSLIILLAALAASQTITPYYVLPVQTTQNVVTSYSFLFSTDTDIASNAWVAITFPFEFSPNALTQVTRVRYLTSGTTLQNATWSLSLYTFTIQINQIAIGNITVVIDGVLNPKDYTTSSYFSVQTLFKNVVVTANTQFARVPFTPTPLATSGGTVNNYVNTYIEQGSSWTFNFTLGANYSSNSSIRFVFPQNFYSNKIQCNVSGVIDPNMQTRVFPSQNVYDCMNLQQPLSGTLGIVLSGVVNPNYQMTASGFQVHILQPNNMIVSEIISSVSTVLIKAKPLNMTLTIPNNYRNNSATYIFQINPDTNLQAGDSMVFTLTGLWTLFTNMTNIISGVNSDLAHAPKWTALVNTTTSITTLTLSNFSTIPKTTQFTFYLPLVTPILPSTYSLTVNSYRFNGGLAQTFTQSIIINQTTGYIREMKLHPMQRAIKLPVGQTGPLQIVLFLQNNLPQTNVLTYGKIVMQITPNIPAPIVSLNGVPKCYFYMNIPAANCTFDSSDPTQTVVTIFTPANFNFQQSEVPLTITTEGYQQPFNQGITIDTLVKRYFFEIQFYSHLRPPPIPQEVIFDEWIPDSIPISSLSCNTMTLNAGEYDHLKCSFVTPNQVLNSGGHIHFFRVEFFSNWYGWYPASNAITADYPCLMYGVNVSATPYVRCDLVTWTSGPYKSSQTTTSYNYITFYGLSTIPGGSTITFEIPHIQRYLNGYDTSLKFSILEDTPGYSSPIVYIYTQTLYLGTNYGNVGGYGFETPSITLSNSVINKVTSITLNNYGLGTSGITQFILEVDQTAFPNIGRGNGIACGSHTCSKFDAPLQYFILYPSTALGSSATLTFPAIATPPYAGSFTFNTRIYLSSSTQKKGTFQVTITPDTIVDCSYKFSPLESISTLYPNSDHFYLISWTTVNRVLSLSGNSYIAITINNIFTLSSTYCQLTTTASAYDGRGIFCQMVAGGTVIYLKNLGDLPAGSTFNLTVQMRSTATTSTVSPTVNIQTYYGNGNLVDQAISVHFDSYPLTNTNLTVFSSFTVPPAFTSVRAITAGYYGNLLVSFQPQSAGTVINGSKIVLTMPTGFYPAGNALGLPLSCLLNNVRETCTYSLTPFTITYTGTNSSFTTSTNVLNITTLYQNTNGIFFPPTPGRYQLQLQILNSSTSESLEKVQQYVDLLPGDVSYFNVSWAHRDINQYNIFTVEFKNGPTPIPSYNDGTTAGRIYIGFPMTDELSNSVFASNLGFSGIVEGSVLPCYFDSGTNFVTATVGKSLTCKIRMSMLTNLYYTWIEVTNFAIIPPGGILRVIIGKITNPSLKQIDIDFLLKVKTIAVSTNIESQLYQTSYNMFIDMLTASITNRNEVNSSSVMFQPGSSVGATNKFFNITPYTGNTFHNNDWFIVNLDPQFPLNGNIYNCLSPFYQYCIIYPTINWLAVKIGNGTIISLQPFISQLPLSISRVDTTFTCYTFLSGRWSETITYTVTAASRWMELRGAVSGFALQVLGSQNKINVGQQDVQILVTFNVTHYVPVGGTIEIQFPNNATTVPAIKPHCRSAVTLGSALNGYNTGKPSVNVEGEIGCLVQNTYSWIITGFDALPAGSQVKIYGTIDFPTVPVNSLGMGYICTYSTQDASSVFANGKTIDYLTTNFPLPVQNYTWNVDTTMSMLKSQPLRINYVGELKFLLNLASTFYSLTSNAGVMYVNLWYYSTAGNTGGFNGPSTNMVCTIFNPITGYKYGCYLSCTVTPGTYTTYKLQTYQNLPTNTNLEVTLTTQKGSATEGINFPTVVGTYKVEIEIDYYSSSPYNKNQAYYVDVYGPNWNALFFNSTVTIPNENNFIMVILTPSQTINTNQQIIIEIPTVSLDGQTLFPVDLGMGYKNYDSLVFDIFESGITSMTCKVYTGELNINAPVKIICSNFNTAITTAKTLQFGFWVVNPTSSVSMAIPIQVYAFDQPAQTKFIWSIVEAGIRVLPITTTPITDIGNFQSSSTYRQITSTTLSFTTRNTKAMVLYDWYIMKFNFDLRTNSDSNGSLTYNTNFAGTGDVIFLRNCMTVLLRIGTTPLNILSSGVTSLNARLNSLFYNPSYQLTTAQATVLAYAVYNSADACEKIIYSDLFPSLVPNKPSGPTFTITSVYSNTQMGQFDDYRFNFIMGSAAGNATSLVKLISIQFPPFTTYDIGIQGKQCAEYSSSSIEVSSCNIDANNRVIWITPVVKTTYTNNMNVAVESLGLAFQNPVNNITINANQFTIRYYTWPDGQPQPSSLVPGSDNWCFMKQDSATLSSSTTTFNAFTNTYYSPHTYLSVPKEVMVNEWEPADYYINNASTPRFAKTPFRFKLIAPATFSALSGNNHHTISLYYGSYYSNPTLNQQSNDLFYYVPTCELNGFRIHSCTISSNTITMNFQQNIANGKEMTVRFSIVNPYDETDEGFTLNGVGTGTITMPIYITPYGGSTFYVEEEPFQPFYRATSAGAAYPSMGISNVALAWGTQAQGQLNYLDFVITLSRNDINGLVLEIPVVNEDGTIIYNDPTLMGLSSGSKYPCSMGVYSSVYCYYVQGSSTNYGTPTRIYIVDFNIPANNSLSFRMLFTNPDNYNVFPKFTFKAFGGSFSPPDTMGDELKGMYTLVDPFMIYDKNNYYSTGSMTCYPSKSLWQTQTYYDCYTADQSQPANTYAILRWPLVDATYATIGDYDSSGGAYDHFIFQTAINQVYVYVVVKLGGTFNPSWNGGGGVTSYYRFGYLRMKHHILNSYNLYLLARDWTKLYTVGVDNNWVWTYRSNGWFGQFTVDTIDVQLRNCNAWSWHYFSINTINAYTTNFNGNEPSEIIIEITFASGPTFQALSNSYPICNIESGVIGHNPLNPVTCVVDVANTKIVLYNVYALTNTQLKILYYAKMACSQSGFDVMIKAFANQQAYAEHSWTLFADQTSQGWNLNRMWYSYQPTSTGWAYGGENSFNFMEPSCSSPSTCTNIFQPSTTVEGGYTQVISATTTQIVMRVYMTGNYDFGARTFRMGFRFYTERLTVSGCNNIGLSSSRYGSNGWCRSGGCSWKCGTGDRMFYVNFYLYRAQTTQAQWPYWYSNDYYDITFTFDSVGQDVSNNANEIFAQGTLVWENGAYYYDDEGHCGCCSTCCCQTCYHQCCNSCYQWNGICYCTYNSCCSTSNCNGYCCCTYCCLGCDCRWTWDWGYVALTNNAGGWSQGVSDIAAAVSTDLVSNQFGVETEFYFYLQNLRTSLTSSMTNTNTGSSQQLIVSFTGNNVFPNNQNPFGYTTQSESAAYIECLCVVSNSAISISAGTSYTAANCTRYVIGGYPAFLTVRINANAGQYLVCYFPGFNTPTTWTNGWTMYVNFYMDRMNHFKYYGLPEQFRSSYQTTGQGIGLTNTGTVSGFNTVTYNGTFWNTYGEVNQNKYYQLYIQSPYNLNSPVLYLSTDSPHTQQSTCNSGIYAACRAYNSYFSRRYFLVVQYNGYTTAMNLTDNLDFPQSWEVSGSYSTYIGWSSGGWNYYYHTWSGSLNSGYFSSATPAIGCVPATFSTNLQYAKSLMSVSVNLNGFKLYSNQRTQGPFFGSFIQLTLSGFSTLYGCGAYVNNVATPTWTNNALYCIVQSNTVIRVYSNADWAFTGYMYITFYTDNVPSSATYTFDLYDKYYSGTNYGRPISVAGTFGRTVSSSYITLQPTSVRWRRTTFKNIRSDAGPVKLTLNNNFQYVSTYSKSSNAESSSSAAIVIYVPGSGLSNNAYYCYAREYLAGQYSFYKEYVVNCVYYSTTQILIKSIPSHIMSPNYYYEFIVYKNTGSGSSLISIPSATNYIMQVGTLNAYSGGAVQYYDWVPVINYLNVYPITLNTIYTLTREAAAINSLFISFTIGFAMSSSNVFHLEFIFDSLDLNYFGIANGGSIPCYLSGFSTLSGKANPPTCYGYADGANSTSPLIIRVFKFSGFSASTTFQIAFDNFNNPPLNSLFLTPINLRMNVVDRTNTKVYTSYFPNIYYSDSVNVGVPSNLGGSIAMSNSNRGAGTSHYMNLNWPYNSNSGDVSQKIVLKIYGGITCCQAFSSLTLSDSQTGYTLLWANSGTNTSVYVTPSKGVNTNTNWYISNVVNPNQVSYQTYLQLMQVTFIMYSSYRTAYITKLNQPSFASYSILTDFNVGSPTLTESPARFNSHSYFPMTYEFSWNLAANSYAGRNISYIIMYFTSGVRSLDCAWFRYSISPYFINTVGHAKVGYDSGAGQWYVNITGVMDSTWSATYLWYVRVRLYANGNGNYIYFTSYVYNYNGNLEFSSTNSNKYIYGDGWRSSTDFGTPAIWALEFQRYTKNYFELAKNVIYAATSQTTNKLFFKFTPPYNMSQVESLSFISSSATYPASATPNNGIYCIIQPTSLTLSSYGAGLYAPCTYSSGTYSVNIPTGGLSTVEYLLTIIDRRQLTTTFNMPATPQRIEVSLIYNSMLNLQYGDVYTLDFAGLMTSYDMDHAHLMSGQQDMLGFTFVPGFTLPAASTSAPVTESVLSFEIESNYYDSCLNIQSVFSSDSMPFYSGVYYSHYSNPAVTNANTRILCGMSTQAQNWSPIKLTVTDYGAVTAGTTYYFRFPLITLPNTGVNNVPLTYKVKLLQYSNGNAYPNIMATFRYENKVSATTTVSITNQWAYLSLSNNAVQKSMGVTFYYNSAYFNIYYSGYETLVKFKNNRIPALTSLSTLPTLSNSGYNYQYYPNINLCSFIRNVNGNNYGFSLGTYPTSIDQQFFELTFVKTFTSNTAIHQGWFNSGSNLCNTTISQATSWTSSTYTKGSNIVTSSSMDLYTVSWIANYLSFPEGSYMVLTFDNNFAFIDQYCYSHSGFLQGINANSNLVCKQYSSNQILIAGYATLSSSATLSISVYMQLKNLSPGTYSQYVNIIVYSSTGTTIINANTVSLVLTVTGVGSLSLDLSGTMVQPYTNGNSFPLYISFQLNTHTLTNGDYIQVDFGNWVLDAASTGVQVFKYRLSGTTYWVPSAATLVSGNIYKVPVYNNYSMNAGTQITLWVDTFAPTSYYGAKSSAIQWNTFKIYAYHSGLVEQAITRIWTEPFGHPSFAVTPALNYVGATTLWEFSVTPNISANAGDTILIEFQTADGIQNTLFSNSLGVTIPAGNGNSGKLDCSEIYNTHVISNSIIQCRVYAGDNTQSPPIPTTIAIPITNAISANAAIKFNIINILNPSVATYPISVAFKLATPCSSSDSNNLCSYYKSITYLTFNNNPGVPGSGYTGSLSFSPALVSATNTKHTVSAPYTLNSGDFVKLIYYPQIPIPTVCTMFSNNGVCYSYPSTNSIIIKVNTTVAASYSLVLSGMTNPYQNYYGTYTFYTEIWRNGQINWRFYSDYQATTITTDPTTSTALSISFTPTLTPNYELKYNFWNIANVTITKMLQNKYVQQIRINAPGQITIDTQYCNATLQTFPGQALPYPYRFICQSLGSNNVMLNLMSNFPAWTSGFTQRSIYVYLRYTIQNYQTVNSNTWNAYAYTDPSSTSWYYAVSYATGNFPIVEYQLPFLYVINFPTRSFNQRTCTIGQQCMIYGFLYPTTPIATMGISYMTFLLPREFNYSSLQIFDSCFIQSTTTTYFSFQCPLTRNNSRITIGFNPPSYNQLYNLFNIDHTVPSMLFTAPSYPGNHYQMQVNLWSASNALVESQYINLTTVYGYYLSVPLINFVIPLDASQYGLYDLTFTTGTADILPSYTNSATYTITSAIQISFANTFDAALGTGLAAGSQIACLNISGLTFNIMGKLTCRIYPSVSTITYPTIIVTGYDRIYANTVVRIQFANLKTLAAGITDYCTLGVSYTYYNYGGVKGYIYQPVSFVVGPTTPAITPKAITYTISEVSTNYVGQLSNYTLAGTIAAGFSPVTTSDYFVVQFPPFIFEGRFNLNYQALCSLGASNACRVFGLASQVYIQPSATVTASAFSFTIKKLLNAAYQLEYLNKTIKLFTVVGNKVNALGYASFTKFTQASLNASAIITSIDSIYGGDSGINYYFSFQLNSYLPEDGKVSIFFPSIFISLFTVNSRCFLRADSQLIVGPQAYCQIINTYQLVIVPNGVLLSASQAYYVTVTNITNPNLDLSNYKFKLETYYSSNVYSPSVVSRTYFACPTFSLITVKNCQLQISASIYNQNLPSQYQINLICPATIKQSSELKLYLSWNPAPANLTCSSDSNNLYSTQCNILTEYSQTTKLTYLSIYLRSIQAQKLLSITATIPNGIQGTYALTSTVNYNGFVYLQATSNSYYITGTASTTASTSLSVKSTNYPLNRYYTSIYTFALTNPKAAVSTLQIDVPSILTQSKAGVNCGYQPWNAQDDYFNLMLKDGTNPLNCNMTGQKMLISGLTPILSNLSSSGFLYLTVNGLINPATSVSQANFTFTLINTTSTIYQAVGIYTLSLSYSVSNAPVNLQIASIILSDPRYFVNSLHTFAVTSVQNAAITIVNSSNMGIIVQFPQEYAPIWQQIAVPSVLNMTINGSVYAATNITLKPQYLFARFPLKTFTSQLIFTSLSISFNFKNPNKSIDCSESPVYVLSFFDFQANSIFAQTLSNNQICPTLSNRLFAINVTGNTKISAGSSAVFVVSIEKPASYLAITPSCTSSAISFLPSVIIFQNFSSTTQNFTISAAVGLSGNFNVTFSKTEGWQNFYNDIQFTTLNIYIPTQSYKVSILPFSAKSTGYPIAATIQLEVPSPTDFALTFNTSCNSNFTFNPASRISIPAQSTMVSLYITYTGQTVPEACQLNFSISALTSNNFVLANSVVYLSGKPSFDKSSNTPPLILQLTTSSQKSTSVGSIVVSATSTTSTSASKYQTANAPTLYNLTVSSTGSNSANFLATTSTTGTIYYAALASGTPTRTITQQQIFGRNISNAIIYGSANSSLNASGVNIISNFVVKSLSTQTSYILAAYLNSTVGSSNIVFQNFSTTQASNGASIKLAMSSPVNTSSLLSSLSSVWRIQQSRIGVLTVQDTLTVLQSSFSSSVMNNRTYIYEIVVAPDTSDDSVRPIDLLNTFAKSSTQQSMLLGFISQYITTYSSTTREIIPAKPKVRSTPTVISESHDKVIVQVKLWEQAYVYGVILPNPTNTTLSAQVIKGVDASNVAVVSQHYSSVISDQSGTANLSFTLLNDNSSYTVFISAECVLPFTPRLALNNTEVLAVPVQTKVNLNLMKNSEHAVTVINQINPALAAQVKKHMNKINAATEVEGSNKNQKRRAHK